MTQPDPSTIKRIVEQAGHVPSGEREAFLRSECAGDEQLLGAVRARLEQGGPEFDPEATLDLGATPDSEMTIDIDTGADVEQTVDLGATPDAEETIDLEGSEAMKPAKGSKALPRQINDFRIIGLLGRGGMGAVYLAEQLHPKRRVALKVIRSKTVTEDSLKRFEVEGHTLAKLSHPGIAQVFAAGVHEEDGRSVPFFAMEYVEEAVAITDWVKEQGLGGRASLELFADVCEAVAHGHQRGVIHRDLKPQNIIVNELGELKVIDFGVAQVEEEEGGGVERKRQIVGTLQYMPPEQVRGETDMDTSSDVYALGILLYQLLVGDTPYDIDTSSVAAATTSIITAPIPSVFEVKPALGRDLDAIVKKAVAKEREDRYPTASELGADVRRYLADEPIMAREQTASEAIRRFMRKHRAATSAIAIVSIVVVLGLVAVSIFAYRTEIARAEEQRQRGIADAALERVEAERLRLEKIVSFQSEMIGSIEPNQMGRSLVDGLADSVRDRLREAGVPEEEIAERVSQQEELSREFNPTEVSIQLIDEHLLRRALATIPRKFAEDKETEADVREIVADAYEQLGRYSLAEPEYERALEIRTEIFGPDHERTLKSMNGLGLLRMSQGRLDEARTYLEEVVEGRRTILGSDHPEAIASIQNLGTLAHREGDNARAEELWLEALEASTRVNGELHPITILLTGNLGVLLSSSGRVEEAEPYTRRNYELSARLYGPQHPQTLAAKRNLAQIALVRGQIDKAAELIEEVVAGYRTALGDRHPETLSSIAALGTLRLQQGEIEEAVELFRTSYEGRREMLGDDHPETFISLQQVAQAHLVAQRFDEAEPYVRSVANGFMGRNGEAHPQTLAWMDMLALVLRDTGRFEEALARIERIQALCAESEQLAQQPICQTMPDRLVRLYTKWHEQSPGSGYDELAREWQEKADAAASPKN